MKLTPLLPLLSALLIAAVSPTRADQPAPAPTVTPIVQSLWPTGKMPGKGPKEGAVEHAMVSRGDNVTRLTDITDPSITVFKAPGASKTTPAVIISPGGAYGLLGIDKEGTEIAAWLNSIGITGIVLKYRVPSNMEGAFQDIQRAMRLVRKNAADWNVDPKRVGVIGFSAGGHLSARLSNNYDQSTYAAIDAADTQPLRPDFTVLLYPAYLSQGGVALSKEMRVNAKTPPTFLVHTDDDKSFVPGTKLYHAALEAAQVPNEFFLLPAGGHGYGLRAKTEINQWPKKCQAWLVKQKLL
jgi:acetyl esterase/lipase